ncbi:hypothetical protein MMC30_000739 [Trapelia coarctata]|nr:hypothetical protein [Trapelia coarctata]
MSRKCRASRERDDGIPTELHDLDVDLMRPKKLGELPEGSSVTPELPDTRGPKTELEGDARARVELQDSTTLYEVEAPPGPAHERP